MNKRATTARNLQKAINEKQVLVKNAIIESKESDNALQTSQQSSFKMT